MSSFDIDGPASPAAELEPLITDHLDGSSGADTATFVIGGVSYEIDLDEPARFATVLGQVIAAGRQVGRGGAVQARSAWIVLPRGRRARRGLAVSERGRISAEVVRRYEAATRRRSLQSAGLKRGLARRFHVRGG
jgi:hypothetical protein